jgi:hypothetical protein
MRCGTVRNFNASILKDAKRGDFNHWYFKTPVKSTDKGGHLREATIDLAFPFIAKKEDDLEAEIIERLTPIMIEMQDELLATLNRTILTPNFNFSIIPFWANEKGSERNERKDFANTRVHIINAVITVNFRNYWLQ